MEEAFRDTLNFKESPQNEIYHSFDSHFTFRGQIEKPFEEYNISNLD